MTHPVLQFEELRKNAMNTGDVESFRELFDPAMIYRHSTGVVDNVHSYLEKLISKKVAYSNVTFSDVTVITPEGSHQSIALVMGLMRADVMRATGPDKIQSHYQATWHQVGSAWKLLAIHGAPIK